MKSCNKCGNIVPDDQEKCVICGAKLKNNIFSNSAALFKSSNSNFNPTSNKDFSSPEKSTLLGPNFSPKPPMQPLPNKPNQDQKNSSNETKPSNKTIICLVLIGILIIGVGYLVLSKTIFKTDNIVKEPNVKAPELKDPSEGIGETTPPKEEEPEPVKPESPEEPADPTPKPNPPKEEPVDPPVPSNMQKRTLGNYVFLIPKKYTIADYEKIGITITDFKKGTTITITEGVKDITSYRDEQEEAKKNLESQGTIVNKMYDTKINNHDVHILELKQESLNYIMAITPALTIDKTFVISVANMKDTTKFDYDILNDALKIIDDVEPKK